MAVVTALPLGLAMLARLALAPAMAMATALATALPQGLAMLAGLAEVMGTALIEHLVSGSAMLARPLRVRESVTSTAHPQCSLVMAMWLPLVMVRMVRAMAMAQAPALS